MQYSATPTLLVVDDQEWNRELFLRRLERSGLRILVAADGHEALRLIEQETIDLVILDIMMPGLSGIEVLKILRRSFPSSELPVIMATAKDQSEDIVEALETGANDYVTKPLDFPVLLARIQTQLRLRTPKRSADPNNADLVTYLGAIRPGMVLMGKYQLEDPLGAGNFGAVYRATHLGLQHRVAVKLLQTTHDEQSALARFQQEGISAFHLRHPNAVGVLDFSVTPGGLAFLVMELLEGHSLERELQEKGRLSPRRCGEIVLPICDVLAEAHALGIVHRDVKPANIFLHATHRGEVVKVLDFGIAKWIGDTALEKNLTLDNQVIGTPVYMAPERIGNKPYDGRADVYSLGVMLYQMLAGRPPFQSSDNEIMVVAIQHLTVEPESLGRLRPELPPPLETLVMQTLIKDYQARPTVLELARKLARILDLELPARLRQEDDAAAPKIRVQIRREPSPLPDAARPDAARPDAARPDAARPDAARPGAARPGAARPTGGFSVPAYGPHENVVIEPMSRIRQITAAHMIYSKATSAHVTTVFHLDLSRIARIRQRAKDKFQRDTGTKLTFMPFVFRAVSAALRKYPQLNAAIDGTNVVYKKDINLGMAVAMDRGLIVPVLRRADELSLVGLAKAANDLADRARSKKLQPEETQGGTFTITNPGVFGSLFGTPIINQPQVAILGVGTIEKRPVVVTADDGEDVLAIRTMSYFALTFDHRLIDGADADYFMLAVKASLETDDWGELKLYL